MREDDFSDMRGDLHPDLRGHIRPGPQTGMMFLHHKLVVTIAMPDGLWGHVNRLYEHKLSQIAEARAEADWSRYVFLHERAYRTDALMELVEEGAIRFTSAKHWRMIHEVWIDSESVQQYDEFWSALWLMEGSRLGMKPAEHKALAALGDPITVYHGLERPDPDELGFSWTTARKTGVWFAQRFSKSHDRDAYLATGTVAAKDVRAYLLSRSEFEIIAFPETVTNVRIERL